LILKLCVFAAYELFKLGKICRDFSNHCAGKNQNWIKISMKLTKIFSKDQPAYQGTNAIIRDELKFLLEGNERRFAKQLLAHLLDEGCNLPIKIAKPRFYELMLTSLFAKASPSIQEKFGQKLPALQKGILQSQDKKGPVTHVEFFETMLFFESQLKSSGKQMAIEVTKSLDTIKKEWQLDDSFFQEGLDHFEIHLQTKINQICQGVQTSDCNMPLELVRRRLYIALTTSLLRHIKGMQSFQTEFGSVPQVVKAMRDDHTVFCRVMAFFKERIPYFSYIASRSFWRTLETLRLEAVRSANAKL
jgi:hypothetical protein